MTALMRKVNDTYISEALSVLPKQMDSINARVMLLAIGMQESRLVHTRQIKGPARGYWQFEKGGGAFGILNHNASKKHLETLCKHYRVPYDLNSIFAAIEQNQGFAAGCARLLLWTDPRALPVPELRIATANAAWDTYMRNWRPGKPHFKTWIDFYFDAVKCIQSY